MKDDQKTQFYVTRITDGCSTFFQHVYLFLIPYIPAGFATFVPVMARQRNASSVHANFFFFFFSILGKDVRMFVRESWNFMR